MPTCPNGHQSASDDWCEVCGHRMAAPTGTPGAPSYGYGYPPTGEPTAQAELCPQCRTPREAMAPFCEECRYNFLTRTATSYTPLSPDLPQPPPPPGMPAAPQAYSQDHFDYQGSRPSRVNRPAEPLQREDDWMLPPPGRQDYQQPPYQQQPPPPQQQQAQQQQAQQAPPGYPQQQPSRTGQYQPPPHHQQQAPPPQQSYQQQPYQPQGGGSWSATIGPDRTYFMAMMRRSGPEAAGLDLPAYSPEQHLPLSGGQITIGRRRASTGESPDIDLSVPPEDPGVSHQHAVLVQQPDGSWAVVDQNSTNGTTINDGEDSIQPYVPVPLADGDRVHVGAWTTITVRHG
ncbi:FHA domain-containing protein [Streptomyces sp. AP-93]|uniref:FHA domain-containing protein n=1 Tax=Streptomyces sp. AP-93 TaxID=2929048 RepID=UPI001FB04420|nr:FHA domain-containing protein [Streptomyces sp. AP-93]MCJ0870856.1 FHA domain-containing protein [Streptomyces sp. AP-93]